MARAIRLGVCYFGMVFIAGVAFGVLRIRVVAPRLGEVIAVVIELPFMLGVSWLACRRLLAGEPLTLGARLLIGSTGFALLMLAELGLAVWGFGQTPAAYVAALVATPGLIGLAGQLGFAMMPLILSRTLG